MPICKCCQESPGGVSPVHHVGFCDNARPKSFEERGVAVTMVEVGGREVPQFAPMRSQTQKPIIHFPPRPRNNVVIGVNNDENGHHNCVLIGTNLKAERDFQLKIGNSEVTATRELTQAEFESLLQMAQHIADSL